MTTVTSITSWWATIENQYKLGKTVYLVRQADLVDARKSPIRQPVRRMESVEKGYESFAYWDDFLRPLKARR